jgi:ABC-2 type transport system permease protein
MIAEVYLHLMITLQRSLAIAKKNARIYYLKPPVLIFGLLFPSFMFLAFSIGRTINPAELVPALLGMTILFAASSVGPLITPWERQAGTYERLLTIPVSSWHIVVGDVGSSFVYGLLISLLSLFLGICIFNAGPAYPIAFILVMFLSVCCFSALGAAMAALPTDQLSNVMMLSSLIRLPMIFISGVFVPLKELPLWGQVIARISPLSYTMDLVRWSFGNPLYFNKLTSCFMLIGFTLFFLYLAHIAHRQANRIF